MEISERQQIEQRNICKLLKESDEIVISGMGGRLPLSNSTDEFADNLYNNIDMITPDENNERWPKGKLNLLILRCLIFFSIILVKISLQNSLKA